MPLSSTSPARAIACGMAAPRRKPIQIEDAGVPAAMKGFPLRKTPWQKAQYLLLLGFPPITRPDSGLITQREVAWSQTDEVYGSQHWPVLSAPWWPVLARPATSDLPLRVSTCWPTYSDGNR